MRLRPPVLFLIAFFTSACHREANTLGPFPAAPVILISIDTLRADHLPAYGYKAVATPALDALAADGVVFEHVYSQCPLTLPSHVTTLTGLLPTTHGVRNNLGFRYDAARFVSLPQTLHHHGYVTGGAVSSYVLRGDTGLRSAFDWYDDEIEERPGVNTSELQRNGHATAEAAQRWLGGLADARSFFCFLHLYEPHAPYAPPEPFRSRYTNPYDGEIAAADDIVGGFVSYLKNRGFYDRSIIIVMSDHGEGLGDHGEQQHGALLYVEEIHVPLIVKLPGNVRKGVRVSGNGALVDLVPTVEKLLGLQAQKSDGLDLFGVLPGDRAIYSETIYPYLQLGWSDLRSLLSDRIHYISSSRPELYDLVADPHEHADVIADHRREAAKLRQLVAAFPPPTAGNVSVDPETAAKLAALGYVGSVKPLTNEAMRPNPRDVIGTIDETREAFRLLDEGRTAEGIQRMKALVAKNPYLVDVWIRLAEASVDTRRPDEAVDAYKHAIAAAGPFAGDILIDLSNLYLQLGRLNDAEQTAKLAVAGNPKRARALLVRIAGTRGDLSKAESIAQEMVNAPDADASDVQLLAEVKVARGELAPALSLLDDAERRAAPGRKIPYGLYALRGEILARQGRPAEAIPMYERQIALFPHNIAAYTILAALYADAKQPAAIDRTLDALVRENPTAAVQALAAQTRRRLGR
ncbi:MAG: sulfatase-like hydrolase/transferase [Thermoanaerobaculia bacterium]